MSVRKICLFDYCVLIRSRSKIYSDCIVGACVTCADEILCSSSIYTDSK